MKKTKNKNRDAQKKRTSHKVVESVLRPEGSLWWERFVKKVRRGVINMRNGPKPVSAFGFHAFDLSNLETVSENRRNLLGGRVRFVCEAVT